MHPDDELDPDAQAHSDRLADLIREQIAGNGGGTFFNPADGQYDDGVFMKAQAIANGSGIIQ